jgi:TP901 family phage tail tape measure protein
LQRELNTTGTHVTALKTRLDSLKLTAMKAGLQLTAAFAIATPIKDMISDAAKLQKEMIGIGLGARGSAADLTALRGVIEDVAGKTMFSSVDVAKMGKQLATGTGWNRQQVAADLPIFAQFADAQQIMKGTSYTESTKTGIQLAHLAGYSKPEDISKYLDLLTKASFTIPGGLGEIAHSLKYSQNALKTLGLSDDQSILLNATLNRMGLSGSRGGTTAIAALTRSIPGIFGSGLLKGKSAEALQAMGMADAGGHSTVFSNGKFDTLLFMKRLADYEQSEFASHPEAIARQNILKNLQRAGGVNGARGMELLASPAAVAALQSVQQSLDKGAGTAAVQQTFADQSVLQQFNNAKTNFTTLMSELGYTLLPTVSQGLKGFNTGIQKLIELVRNHPNIAAGALYAGVGAAGILGAGAALNMGRFALGGFGLFREVAQIGTAATAASGSIAAAGGAAVIAASIAGIGVVLAGIGLAAADVLKHTDFLKNAATNPGGIGFHMGQSGSFTQRLSNSYFSAAPHSASQQTTINTTVQLDGQKVGQAVTKYQAGRLNSPNNGSSGFDNRMSPIPAGSTGSW